MRISFSNISKNTTQLGSAWQAARKYPSIWSHIMYTYGVLTNLSLLPQPRFHFRHLRYSLFLPCICVSETLHLSWFLSIFSLYIHLSLSLSLTLSLSLSQARPLNALTCSGFRLSQACSSTLAHVCVCVCVSVCVCVCAKWHIFHCFSSVLQCGWSETATMTLKYWLSALRVFEVCSHPRNCVGIVTVFIHSLTSLCYFVQLVLVL